MTNLSSSCILLIAFWTTSTLADISGTTPAVGSCLCPSTANLYIRDTPCGNVIDTVGINPCYSYTGNSQKCTLDIEYEFFQLDIDGQVGWAIGNYLNQEPNSYCGEFACGLPSPSSDLRIIEGKDAVRDAFPWQLAVEEDVSGVWTLACGGALIDANWALTAAHCVEDFAKTLRLVAGVYDRSEPIDTPFQVRNINSQHITLHPDYNSTTLLNDIAVISIPAPYNLSTTSIRTICLPASVDSSFVENPSCHISGWGPTISNSTSMPTVLQQSGIEVIKPKNCLALLERLILPTETCTLDQVSHIATPCQGDLGGPLSCAVDTRFQLAGIGSFTDANCNPRVPQIFSNIPIFLDWIKQVTGLQ